MVKFQTIVSAVILVFFMALAFVGCSDVDVSEPNDATEEPTFSVGGQVSGLEGAGLVLGLNEEFALHVDDNGPFVFDRKLEDGSSYDISVLTQPTDPEQFCDISARSGTIDGGDVDDVEVVCQMPTPATFDVSIDVSTSELEVHATETVVVVVDIENRGDESGTADIELVIGSEFGASEQLSLDGLAIESLAFEWTTEAGDFGEYTAEVSSPDDTDSAPVVVDRPTCEQRTLLGDLDEWEHADDVVEGRDSDPTRYFGVFIGEEFPGTRNSFDFYLPKYEYAAMEFTVPEHYGPGHTGAWRSESSHLVDGIGFLYLTLSDCPGDFDPNHFEDKACINAESDDVVGVHPTRWSTDPDYEPSRYCYLEPGETYYFNVMHVENADRVDEPAFPPQQSPCAGHPNCGRLFQATHSSP